MKEKAHILVVDDSISMCRSMALVLKEHGYAVSTAVDGLEAIDRVKEKPFDITFMDVKMPGMDGMATYKKIKQIRPDAVVIIITAYAVNGLVEEALQEGAYGAIDKPFDVEKVLTMVDEIMEGKRRASSL